MGIVVIGATFVDVKGYPLAQYIPGGRNVGRVVQVHGGVGRNVVEDIANVVKNEIRDGYDETILSNGRHFGYDYRINMGNVKAWFQNEWTFNEVDLYYAIQLNYSSMQRTTNMYNGRAWYLTTLAMRTDAQNGTDNYWKYLGHQALKQLENG